MWTVGVVAAHRFRSRVASVERNAFAGRERRRNVGKMPVVKVWRTDKSPGLVRKTARFPSNTCFGWANNGISQTEKKKLIHSRSTVQQRGNCRGLDGGQQQDTESGNNDAKADGHTDRHGFWTQGARFSVQWTSMRTRSGRVIGS